MRYFFVILAAATLMVSCSSKEGLSTSVQSTQSARDIAIENIMSRTSVRSYTPEPISQGLIDTMLRAAMAAPTGRNLQPWAFVVINDRDAMTSLSESLPYAKMLGESPLAIVVCANTLKAAEDSEGHNLWEMDCSAATQNILLAANALGLGAVWTAGWPYLERVEAISEVLNLPDNLIPLSLVPIGYPDEPLNPKDKWKPENVYYNRLK